MNSAKSTRQAKPQGFGSGGGQSSGARRSEFSRRLWKTSALSTIALAGTGAAYAQDGLWQPQVRTIIGGDQQGAYSSLEGFIPLTQTPDSVLFEKIDALGLFATRRSTVTLENKEVLNLTDFQVVDEAALNALADKDFLDLRNSGALALIYCHLASSNSWNALAYQAQVRGHALKA